jgi:hypothetical protein
MKISIAASIIPALAALAAHVQGKEQLSPRADGRGQDCLNQSLVSSTLTVAEQQQLKGIIHGNGRNRSNRKQQSGGLSCSHLMNRRASVEQRATSRGLPAAEVDSILTSLQLCLCGIPRQEA